MERIVGPMKRAGVAAILILAFCGLANSVYIAQHEMSAAPLVCDAATLSGCTAVAASSYAYLFGISVAEYGIIFYSILFVLAALELVLFAQFLRRLLQGVALIGVFASLYFTSIQLFVIDAFCIYCLLSSSIALLIFVFASFIEPVRRSEQQKPSISSSPVPLSHFLMPPMP